MLKPGRSCNSNGLNVSVFLISCELCNVIVAAQPHTVVPIQAIRCADDDGSRRAIVEPAQIANWVAYANGTFSAASIEFAFDPDSEDFIDINSTVLNSMTGTHDAIWREARALANSIAANYPRKLVVFFRWGPGGAPSGAGFSWWDYNFIVAPGFSTDVCGHQNISLLAHEIGHFLGLPHTFRGRYAAIHQAEQSYLDAGRHPTIFDGDGIEDTLPDPFIASIQCDEPTHVQLAGDIFPIDIDNIMTYWDSDDKTLTPGQIERVTWLLSVREQFDMAMPTNFDVANSREFDDLQIVDVDEVSFGHQDMAGFGLDQWAQNDHLFCGANDGASISFSVNVLVADTYNVDLYATRAPDFGIVQVWWDDVRLGDDVDLYAPLVIPTDKLLLATIPISKGQHVIRFEVVGKNPESTNYYFGLDALTLEPVGCYCDDFPGGCDDKAGFMAACLTGPTSSVPPDLPQCTSLCAAVFDRDADADIDLADIGIWLREFDSPSSLLSTPVATNGEAPAGVICCAK